MSNRFSIAIAAVIVTGGASSAKASYVFTDIIGTKTGSTFVRDVNASGVAVGFTNDSTGIHGFSWTSGVFTPIDVPFGFNTQVNGINDLGVMTGYYDDRVGEHGFVGKVGSFVKFDVPGATAGRTYSLGINNAGTVAGYYQSSTQGIGAGFTYDGTSFTTVSVTGSFATILTSINDSGTLGGTYEASPGQQGFLLSAGGVLTKINAPGGAVANVEGLTNNGQYAAQYTTASTHGQTNGGTVDRPGAQGTTAFGLNDLGQLVGEYTLPGNSVKYYGYITGVTADAAPSTPPSTVPEPASAALLGLGSLFAIRRRGTFRA